MQKYLLMAILFFGGCETLVQKTEGAITGIMNSTVEQNYINSYCRISPKGSGKLDTSPACSATKQEVTKQAETKFTILFYTLSPQDKNIAQVTRGKENDWTTEYRELLPLSEQGKLDEIFIAESNPYVGCRVNVYYLCKEGSQNNKCERESRGSSFVNNVGEDDDYRLLTMDTASNSNWNNGLLFPRPFALSYYPPDTNKTPVELFVGEGNPYIGCKVKVHELRGAILNSNSVRDFVANASMCKKPQNQPAEAPAK